MKSYDEAYLTICVTNHLVEYADICGWSVGAGGILLDKNTSTRFAVPVIGTVNRSSLGLVEELAVTDYEVIVRD